MAPEKRPWLLIAKGVFFGLDVQVKERFIWWKNLWEQQHYV
jgi:hypothetical protein